MNLTLIIGLAIGWLLIMMAIFLGPGLTIYLDSVSMLIVFGGTAGIIISTLDRKNLVGFVKAGLHSIKPYKDNKAQLITTIISYAVTSRKSGILSLEKLIENESDSFLKKGLGMVIDGSEPESIKEILELEIEFISKRHNKNIATYQSIVEIGGAMGMIGTLIGLVAMLVNMDDPSSIGPAMAVALLTTLYGSIIGNLFATPIANVLILKNTIEINTKRMILSGILLIQSGDNPRNLEDKLLVFLDPKNRVSQYDW